MKKSTFDLFAVTAPGLEGVCARELQALGMEEAGSCKGGVAFCGGLEELYRANLWLRTASRILVRLGEFGCRDFPDLYRKALRLPWGRFLKPGVPIAIKAGSRRSRLQHTGRIAETVREAALRVLGNPALSSAGPPQSILVRCEDDRCQISIDSSGELLHRRGYRQMIGTAPLRETLAAGILELLEWKGDSALVDPMCGAGTFIVEGALIAMRMAPGIARDFAFMQWPRYRAGLWQVLQMQARSAQQDIAVPLLGRDRDPVVVEAACRNAVRAGVTDTVVFQVAEIGQGQVPEHPGLVLCNPPYGGRLGQEAELIKLYRRLGEVLRSEYRGWQAAVLCPMGPLARALGSGFEQMVSLDNGGIEVGLFRTRI